MKLILMVLATVFVSITATAQEGILPGEPDPNKGPKSDAMNDAKTAHGKALIDDRKPCKKGLKRYQRMTCGEPNKKQDCQNYSPVLECLKRPPKLNCMAPKVPVPEYRCE